LLTTFSISLSALVCAFLLDLIIGEREGWPHPVVSFGRIIGWIDCTFNLPEKDGHEKKMAGLLLAYLLPVCSFFAVALILWFAGFLGNVVLFIVTLILAYTTLSCRGLGDAAKTVHHPLERGDLPSAREALSHIVGRETEGLEEAEVVRATVETVAENTSDGVIAPLFYLAIGGVPLAMAYKAVNTLDSMVGYKNDKYCDFGWASARLDDILNLIPARLTALLMVSAAFVLKMDWQNAWRIMLRDRDNHPSPNAGWPEAATAGALGIRLGGENCYPGRSELRPFIGDKERGMENRDISKTLQLLYAVSILMLLLILVLKGLL
jgi:adenosylcobinamide-phosphate synthase